jgi:hypothetical protein
MVGAVLGPRLDSFPGFLLSPHANRLVEGVGWVYESSLALYRAAKRAGSPAPWWGYGVPEGRLGALPNVDAPRSLPVDARPQHLSFQRPYGGDWAGRTGAGAYALGHEMGLARYRAWERGIGPWHYGRPRVPALIPYAYITPQAFRPPLGLPLWPFKWLMPQGR